ncbi:MAG: hypothetical protein Q8M20_08120 [Rhodocyclaceae bacterium]|nr:hypothetical protein [Rhodocyclaceae bacterium]MDZ4216436.1 hypothetical protein [Rhodocyclaceae bacterium]
MSDNKASSRPIDQIRNSAMSMKVGAPDDGNITEMVSVSDRMLVVMERAIHVMQLADSIDPARTNISIPNTQQRLLSRGAGDPIVAKTLLTAQTLFKKAHLGNDFDEQRGLTLALDLLKDIASMADMLIATQDAQDTAIARFEKEAVAERHLTLPAIGDAEARCDAFAQKVGHIVDILRDMARLFYGEALKSKWIDSLTELTKERYGCEDPFAKYIEAVRPFLLLLRDLRNMVEHPKAEWHIKVFDFRLLPSGQVMIPSIEIVRPGEEASQGALTLFMSQVTDDIANVAELFMAYLCNANVQSLPPFPIQVLELPLEQRSNPLVRMSYGCIQGDQIIRIG